MESGVFRSWAAEARALVVRWKRCCNSEYSRSRFSGLGTSASRREAGLVTASIEETARELSERHVFFCTLAIGKTGGMATGKGLSTRLVMESANFKNRKPPLICCQRKMQLNYPSVAKACTSALTACVTVSYPAVRKEATSNR